MVTGCITMNFKGQESFYFVKYFVYFLLCIFFPLLKWDLM